MSSSRRSSNQESTSSQTSVEHFSLRGYGCSMSIVFLLIIIAILAYFLWVSKNTKAPSSSA